MFDPLPSTGHKPASFLSIFQMPSAHVVYERADVWKETFAWAQDSDQCSFCTGGHGPSIQRTIKLSSSRSAGTVIGRAPRRGLPLRNPQRSGTSDAVWGERLPDEGQAPSKRGVLVRWHPSGRFYAEAGLHDHIDCNSSFRITDAACFKNTLDWTALQLAGQLRVDGQEMHCRLLDMQWSPDGTELAIAMATGFVRLAF